MLDLKSLISRHSFFPLSDPEFDFLFDDLAVFFESRLLWKVCGQYGF